MGAHYGVGVVDIVENRLVGMKSRGVYENPGGSIIMYAHRELDTFASTELHTTTKNLLLTNTLNLYTMACGSHH